MTIMGVSPQNNPQPFLVSVGNVHATADWIVTPAGSWLLKDTNVSTSDQTVTTTHTPAWAIVMVICFFWLFFLSLLFLFAREVRISGFVAVHIQSGGQSYTEQVPVSSALQRADVINRSIYIQSLIGRARAAHVPL